MKKIIISFGISSIIFMFVLYNMPTMMKKIANSLYRSQTKKKNMLDDDNWTIEYVKKSNN